LKQQTKHRVVLELNRDSPTDKVEDFLDKIDNVIFEIEHQTLIKKNRVLAFISANEDTWRKILLILTAVLNIMMLIYLKSSPYDPTPSLRDNVGLSIAAYVLGGLHALFSVLMTYSYMYTWTPVIWYTRQKAYEEALEGQKVQEEEDPGVDDDDSEVEAKVKAGNSFVCLFCLFVCLFVCLVVCLFLMFLFCILTSWLCFDVLRV
jgi:hypothetical protein